MVQFQWYAEDPLDPRGFFIATINKDNTPHDLIHDLGELYTDCNLPNNTPFWYVVEDMGYPIINELLNSRGIKKCLIVFQW
jgi:hypothetical protein